jgi:hypothetical protein
MRIDDVNYSCYCSVKFQVELSVTGRGDLEEIDEERDEGRIEESVREGGEESYEEIILLASFVVLFWFLEAANDDRWHSGQMRASNTQREDEGPAYSSNIQFFRRINVIYKDYSNFLSLPGVGDFVPQQKYRPHTSSDRRQYVGLQLEHPIYFWMENPDECGIPLMDALHSRVRHLQNRDETIFLGREPSISVQILVSDD